MYETTKGLLQGRVKEEMGMEGQRKFSPMVTSVVEAGVSMKFYALLHAGTQTITFQPGKLLLCDSR